MDAQSILVVDDDLPLARNIALLLKPLGVHTEIAGTAREALDRAQQRAFDLALLDLRLPDADGVQLGAQLQDRPVAPEVMFITGNASVEEAARAVSVGAAGMIVKPFSPTQLLDGVSRALARKREAGRALENRVRASRMETVARLSMGLTHELRNPLNSAQLQLQLALRRLRADRTRGDDGLPARLETAMGELGRLARILADFEMYLEPPKLELERIAGAELLAAVEPQLAAAPRVEVRRELEPEVALRVDRQRMTVALMNLVENALEAMPSGGALTLRCFARGERAVIEVEDTGGGIANVEAIFDPFYSTKPSGTGLGLAVVHRTVSEHGGAIDVASQPGRTTFAISLELAR